MHGQVLTNPRVGMGNGIYRKLDMIQFHINFRNVPSQTEIHDRLNKGQRENVKPQRKGMGECCPLWVSQFNENIMVLIFF